MMRPLLWSGSNLIKAFCLSVLDIKIELIAVQIDTKKQEITRGFIG